MFKRWWYYLEGNCLRISGFWRKCFLLTVAKMAASVILRRAIAQKMITRYYSAHMDPKQVQAAHKMWKNLTIFAVPVALAVAGMNVYLNFEEPVAPEFIPYEHLRIRTKRFPWGDGNKTLFHNPHVNALPSGYEH